jgi:hypothetical protein
MSPNAGEGGELLGSQPISTAVHKTPKINFGDLIPYLTYGCKITEVREKEACMEGGREGRQVEFLPI